MGVPMRARLGNQFRMGVYVRIAGLFARSVSCSRRDAKEFGYWVVGYQDEIEKV
jgi:hypothetical protein